MSQNQLLTQEQFNTGLMPAIYSATSIVTKDYLEILEKCELLKVDQQAKETTLENCGKLFRLTKLVSDKDEGFISKLVTIANVVSSVGATLTTIIDSDGKKTNFYLGVISKQYRLDGGNDAQKRQAVFNAFSGAVKGNLTGTEIEEIKTDAFPEIEKSLFGIAPETKSSMAVSAISGVVSLRNEEDERKMESYVQGIENLVNALRGEKYSIIMIADPLSSQRIHSIKTGYESLHTHLTSFLKSSVTFNESDSLSVSKARMESIADGISSGIALTQSKTKTTGTQRGINMSAGVSFILSANVGFSAGSSSGESKQTGRTENQGKTHQEQYGKIDTTGTSKTAGKSMQLNYENRTIKSILDKIDIYLERLDKCDNYGAFECATYVLADHRAQALNVAGNYSALLRGSQSFIQSSCINTWEGTVNCLDEESLRQGEGIKEDSSVGAIVKYLRGFTHPRFKVSEKDKLSFEGVTPASIISGSELAVQMGFPKKSIDGVTVIPMAQFGRNIKEKAGRSIAMGQLYHMGAAEKNKAVPLDILSLASHTFITGSTGAGKTTAICSILDKLMDFKVDGKESGQIKFMVIEPAKGEYKHRFGYYPNVSVYGTNDRITPLLRINPFSFPDDILVLEHIDRLIEIFNSCWPMYAAMPAVLKDAIECAYASCGWDLEKSLCRYQDSKARPLYPTFRDVLHQVESVINKSQYSADSKGDYKGALCTRIKSLTNGLFGKMLTCDEIPAETLFDENVVVDLSRIGSGETKALLMGLLVMKLQEYRLADSHMRNQPLRHVTVLEEAHHLLKRTSAEQSADSANLAGKAVEMLSDSIAEMRSWGEGFIISDQAPGLLDKAAIRNTNTKIVFRLPDYSDRELVGKAANMNDAQIDELARLETHVAAVYQNDWLEPVLCKVDVRFGDAFTYSSPQESPDEARINHLIHYATGSFSERKKADTKLLRDTIFKVNLSAPTRLAFLRLLYSEENSGKELREEFLYGAFNSESALELSRGHLREPGVWYDKMLSVLSPNILGYDELEQKSIIAGILKAEANMYGNPEDVELFNHLMTKIL